MSGSENESLPFAGLRVVELSASIAAGYCGKMFCDAGAEVVKIEPATGDPMRQWRYGSGPDAAQGALFGYLAAGKRSVLTGPDAEPLLAAADVVLTDLSDGSTLTETAALAGDGAVVVAVTPFGTTGPLAQARAQGRFAVNEFVLQAMCGSTGSRGWPGQEPLVAGGRVGEWVAGATAAVAAAACARHARKTGRGETVDVSIYAAMTLAMGSLGAMGASVLGDDLPVGGRSIELPSIVPTADGLVGFCTITGQQFQDFLVLIDRPDLKDDSDLASFAGRLRRRDEFLSIVHEWASTRTTDEIIDFASALRIPVAPVATPRTVTGIDHFEERGVFQTTPAGAVAPRVPYRSQAIPVQPPGAAPESGADRGNVRWPPRKPSEHVAGTSESLPLADIRVADLTAFWAGPVATAMLAALGADVIKVEGVRRPDGMRFANGRPQTWDQWWEWGPVFLCSNSNKRDISLELTVPQGREAALTLMGRSDLVLENFSPRVMSNFGLDWDVIHSASPMTSLVRMPAFGLDGPWRDRVGFAQTMEQASGMAWMTGTADGLPIVPRGVCDPVAGLHAAFAAICALEVRDRIGQGIQVEATMVEAALNIAAEALIEASLGKTVPGRSGNRGPGASPQGVYRCAGDDEWVALAVLNDRSWPALAGLIGVERAGLESEADRRGCADELDKLIGSWAAQHPPAKAAAILQANGIAAARVIDPAELLDDDQLNAGFWEVVDHPVAGRFKTSGMPFSFASRRGGWVRTAAPTYGQHTRDVLTGLLDMPQTELDRLIDAGATNTRPAGL